MLKIAFQKAKLNQHAATINRGTEQKDRGSDKAFALYKYKIIQNTSPHAS